MADSQALESLIEAERAGWGQFLALVSSLRPDQACQPGYFAEGWSVKDLVAHVAGWLAEAGLVLEQIRVGTYDCREMDLEGMNQRFWEADRDQPLTLVMAQAHAAHQRLLGEVRQLDEVNDDAWAWLRKAGPEHYNEHLPRLAGWVQELTGG